MKLVQAFIRNGRLADVRAGHEAVGITVYTLTATLGSGERHKADSVSGGLRQHLCLEIAIPDQLEETVVGGDSEVRPQRRVRRRCDSCAPH